MSNFEGNVKKNANSFKPQTRASDGAGVGRVVAGVYAGQDAPVVFEKADSPILDTDPTPRTDGRGEAELGLHGPKYNRAEVDHPNNDGKAVYAAAQIAREYRRIEAQVGGIENLSVEQRRQMRDELVRHVGATADGAQQPEGDSASARATRTYVREVASLLFGLIDELSETPDFLRAPKPPAPDSDRVGMIGSDYLKPKSVNKSASHAVLVCPFCSGVNHVERNTIGGLQKITCSSCAGNWQQDLALSTFTKSADPTLADLRKQLAMLTERLRGIIARGAGHMIEDSHRGGGRFVTKSDDPKKLLKHALDNGVSVPFSGADPRSAAEKSAGSGRKFQPR